MSLKSKTAKHPYWGRVASESYLVNADLSPNQSNELEIGDFLYVDSAQCLYYCKDATLGSAVWSKIGGGSSGTEIFSKPFLYTVGNSISGDTVETCDYLDVGDGVKLTEAVIAAAGSGAIVFVRPGIYDFSQVTSPTGGINLVGCTVLGYGAAIKNKRSVDIRVATLDDDSYLIGLDIQIYPVTANATGLSFIYGGNLIDCWIRFRFDDGRTNKTWTDAEQNRLTSGTVICAVNNSINIHCCKIWVPGFSAASPLPSPMKYMYAIQITVDSGFLSQTPFILYGSSVIGGEYGLFISGTSSDYLSYIRIEKSVISWVKNIAGEPLIEVGPASGLYTYTCRTHYLEFAQITDCDFTNYGHYMYGSTETVLSSNFLIYSRNLARTNAAQGGLLSIYSNYGFIFDNYLKGYTGIITPLYLGSGVNHVFSNILEGTLVDNTGGSSIIYTDQLVGDVEGKSDNNTVTKLRSIPISPGISPSDGYWLTGTGASFDAAGSGPSVDSIRQWAMSWTGGINGEFH